MEKEMIEYEEKFFVINYKHLRHFSPLAQRLVHTMFDEIRAYIPENKYYVCNQDEPYAGKIIQTILEGEKLKMKISETIERECCQRQDFLPYKGLISESMKGNCIVIKTHKPVFCKHCGQVWIHTGQMGPVAGATHPSMEKVAL